MKEDENDEKVDKEKNLDKQKMVTSQQDCKKKNSSKHGRWNHHKGITKAMVLQTSKNFN